MAFVPAVLGGAAAVEISKLLHKDTKVSIKDLEALQTKEEELKEVLQASNACLTQFEPLTIHNERVFTYRKFSWSSSRKRQHMRWTAGGCRSSVTLPSSYNR